MCYDIAYIPDLSVNVFIMTRALTKGFNITPEKESLVLNKNGTIMKYEDIVDHGNGADYQLAERL